MTPHDVDELHSLGLQLHAAGSCMCPLRFRLHMLPALNKVTCAVIDVYFGSSRCPLLALLPDSSAISTTICSSRRTLNASLTRPAVSTGMICRGACTKDTMQVAWQPVILHHQKHLMRTCC